MAQRIPRDESLSRVHGVGGVFTATFPPLIIQAGVACAAEMPIAITQSAMMNTPNPLIPNRDLISSSSRLSWFGLAVFVHR